MEEAVVISCRFGWAVTVKWSLGKGSSAVELHGCGLLGMPEAQSSHIRHLSFSE